jgi:hypothetical protein
MYSNLSGFGAPMEFVRLYKMCLVETYINVWINKHWSDAFPVRNCLIKGNSILVLLFNIYLECVFKKVQASTEDVNFLGQPDLSLRKLKVY